MRFALVPLIGLLAACIAAPSVEARAPLEGGEARAAAAFEGVADNGAMLRVFLQAMPKGGDLHNHLSGTPSAEDYLAWAAREGYCADRQSLALVAPPCAKENSLDVIASDAPFLYGQLVDHLSTRGWQQGVGTNEASGHTRFFGAFDHFAGIAASNVAASLVVARRTAAGDHVSYLELMHNPVATMGYIFGGPDAPLDADGLAQRYAAEIGRIAPVVAQARKELDASEAQARATMHCAGAEPEPACAVSVRYLGWGLRALPPVQAFRSLLVSFALADADPRFLGVNIVQPEDFPVALRDYDLHMAMLRFLEAKYPKVHRTFHAGELAFGLVLPAAMKDHMAKALASGAERIGHGTAIAYEADAAQTLATMAQRHVAVEVNLTSNAVILGVTADQHPLHLYRRFGVPVVLSTDDQGLLRTDMTGEYVRAVREQGLGYTDLKDIARASLEYAFVPGESIWADHALGVPVAACRTALSATACKALMQRSEKARLQVGLEDGFTSFEGSLPAPFSQ